MERIKVCRAALKVSYQVIDRHDNLSPTETLLTVMMDALKALFKQPYWIIALILGAPLVALPCVTIDKDYHWATHPPTTLIPVVFGASLLACSILAFGFTLWTTHSKEAAGTGLDLTRVKEQNGEMWTVVNGSEIRVATGRLEDYVPDDKTLIVLPSNEYFDDECANDQRSSLGAYVHGKFEGQANAFDRLVQEERQKQLAPGNLRRKTAHVQAEIWRLVNACCCSIPSVVRLPSLFSRPLHNATARDYPAESKEPARRPSCLRTS